MTSFTLSSVRPLRSASIFFRVFDALNDTRNFEAAFEAVADSGKHIQGTVCYSVTERHMGGPVFTRDYFVDKAKEIEKMGAHSLWCQGHGRPARAV